MLHSCAASWLSEAFYDQDGFTTAGKYLVICETTAAYRPRNPEAGVLYGVVSRHLETFMVRQREHGRLVPRFVERELRALLAELYSASISGRVATGPRASRRIARVGDEVDSEDGALPSGRCCASVAGFSVHAGVCVPARDRMRLSGP
jgi:hypothetical protein